MLGTGYDMYEVFWSNSV